jgi:hypothetical protein
MSNKSEIKLPQIHNLTKIGSFDVKDKIVIGDTDYTELKLRTGKYDAYKLDDNLMILNNDLNIKPDKNMLDWSWKHSGNGVGVDTGFFGFYDLYSVKSINKILKDNENMLPNFKFINDASIVDGKQLDTECWNWNNLTEDSIMILKNTSAFGVISQTGVGDGGFESYIIDDDKAILIGGITGSILFDDSYDENENEYEYE